MEIRKTRVLKRQQAIQKIKSDLDSKKDRIVKNDNLLYRVGLKVVESSCIFSSWLTQEEYNQLLEILDKLTDIELQKLIRKINNDNIDYLIRKDENYIYF